MSERYPHVFATPTHCAHCGSRPEDDDADMECPVRLRQALNEAQAVTGRHEAANREFFRWTASGPKGCPPYASYFGTALERLDESFAALRSVEDHLRDEIVSLTSELYGAQAVIAVAADRILWPGTLDPAEQWWLESAAPHIAAHKARQEKA